MKYIEISERKTPYFELPNVKFWTYTDNFWKFPDIVCIVCCMENLNWMYLIVIPLSIWS